METSFQTPDIQTHRLVSESTSAIRAIAEKSKTEYVLLFVGPPCDCIFTPGGMERMEQIARSTGAVMVYSDYRLDNGESIIDMPTIDWQQGALRNDFDFGRAILFETAAFISASESMDGDYSYAGFYDLWLRLAQQSAPLRIPEFLYSVCELSVEERIGEEQFDYVDPRNAEVQIEMEKVCTAALSRQGALLTTPPIEVDTSLGNFPVEASVIIPVRNRVRTICDAIHSALSQDSDFSYNVIVVDNQSTDGTTEAIRENFGNDPKVIHILPITGGLGIGGCWNLAVEHPLCGRYAIQLDSDDIYSSPNTLSCIVETFRTQKCGMVVGSYELTDFNLNSIPPGLIDHKEWTATNGRNNLLRINGMGAPRAFYTPLIRECKFPNVSYGEDYAVALWFTRTYRIGRIYESLYCCRRWEGNSDSNLNRELLNRNNSYKDFLRTVELQARMKL